MSGNELDLFVLFKQMLFPIVFSTFFASTSSLHLLNLVRVTTRIVLPCRHDLF